nr:hypothetical protein Iba_chr09cCG3150 [Ipomoea batatas]GMD36912.1 hypothetical protein Iba_chr09eCG4410 [Ipomoea batatas]GMD38469.1 hypothetical protein Iba_chr09fCG4250 [Ipomoea batatas]GME13138.1 hypothetical protein Iba_scaffold14356CG0010 [Ipomoea batatas]GME18733.1 hypothetical protein Iba_scaffold21144CG0030 [Ipomoea batatas]
METWLDKIATVARFNLRSCKGQCDIATSFSMQGTHGQTSLSPSLEPRSLGTLMLPFEQDFDANITLLNK